MTNKPKPARAESDQRDKRRARKLGQVRQSISDYAAKAGRRSKTRR